MVQSHIKTAFRNEKVQGTCILLKEWLHDDDRP
jgi:hypothetical protein